MGQANAAVRGGITGQCAPMQGDAAPGEALHIGHGRIVVDRRIMFDLALQYGEDAGRGAVSGLAG